jgi:nucleotide-binding universal stress UspA family protein
MPLFRTILFAADFSERSKEAFRIACALADETQTRLIVLHVVEHTPIAEQQVVVGELGSPIVYSEGGPGRHDALKDRLREYYIPAHPIDLAYHVRDGVASAELLGMANELGADLIALGTHGRRGLRRLLAGSVAEAVLRGARCAVLALHSSELAGQSEGFRVILHPTDFSDCSASALQVARYLARAHGAQLLIIHVAPIEVLINETTAVAMDPQAYRDALRQMRDELDGPDLKFPVKTQLKEGDAVGEILATAQEAGCDLIVMGTSGRTGLGRLLMGSAAEGVLRGARCPVLAVKKPIPSATAAVSPREEASA